MSESRRCIKCARLIPHGRLILLPNTQECVRCSTEKSVTQKDVDIDSLDIDDLVHRTKW